VPRAKWKEEKTGGKDPAERGGLVPFSRRWGDLYNSRVSTMDGDVGGHRRREISKLIFINRGRQSAKTSHSHGTIVRVSKIGNAGRRRALSHG